MTPLHIYVLHGGYWVIGILLQAVLVSCQECGSIRHEVTGTCCSGFRAECVQHQERLKVPKADAAILAGGGKHKFTRVELQAGDWVRVAQGCNVSPGRKVPHLQAFVL